MNYITKYIENKNFHTTLINCIFEFKCNKEEVMAYTILAKLLSKSNKKYPSIDLFAREKLNRYIMNLNVISQSINDVYFLNFSCLLPSNDVIKEEYLDSSINFLLDSIYDTNIIDIELFEREKRLYTETLLNNYKNIEFIAEKNMLDLIDNDCKINKIKYKDLENIQKLTIDDVVTFYNKYIKNIKPKIFIYGNIDKECVNEIFTNYFTNLNLKEYKIIKDFNYFYKNDSLIEKTDLSKYHQSIIYMIYNIKNYKEEDFYMLYLINSLLSNPSSDLLFYNLRKKNNLVYSCGSSIMLRNGLLIMKAITNKQSIKVAKLVMEKVINDLKDINNIKDNINRIIEKLELNIIREKDNFFIEPSDIINKYFKSDITSEELLKIIKNINEKELLDCINRLEIKCIYTLEGVE